MIRVRSVLQAALAFAVLGLSAGSARAGSCDYTIGLSVKVADARTNFSSVRPGNTVCIAAGNRNNLTVKNFQGTASSPITFINSGGRVVFNGTSSFAVHVQNCRYYRLTGTGDAGYQYGIFISGKYTIGVKNGNRSSDLEVDHVEVAGPDTGEGIETGTKPNCPDASDRTMYDYDNDGKTIGDLDDIVCQEGDPNFRCRNPFTQYNSRFHHNYMHGVSREGFYLGNNRTVFAPYAQGQGNAVCRGQKPEYPLEPVINGLWVYSNRVIRSGWSSINVKGVPKDCFVYSNDIYEDSTVSQQGHEGGVHLNLDSHCDVYKNFIKDGYSAGVIAVGIGGRIYNNIIVNPGRNFGQTEARGSAIHLLLGTSENNYYVWNNTIVSPKSFGVHFDYKYGSDNRIENNIIVNPGACTSDGDRGYVFVSRQSNAKESHNLKRLNIADVKFANPAEDDYSLLSGSPAINAGINLTSYDITQDYLGISKPAGAKCDIGAYQFAPGSNLPHPQRRQPTSE